MNASQKRRLAAVDAETDGLAARLKWAHAANRAGRLGIADLPPPPGGWPAGVAPSTPRHETPPAVAVAGQRPIRYAEPALPDALAHEDMAPFRLPALRAAKAKATSSAKPSRARAGAIDPDAAARRGRRNAARKIAAVLGNMK